jgi:hypothetical protein
MKIVIVITGYAFEIRKEDALISYTLIDKELGPCLQNDANQLSYSRSSELSVER